NASALRNKTSGHVILQCRGHRRRPRTGCRRRRRACSAWATEAARGRAPKQSHETKTRIGHLISGIIGPIGSKVPTCVSHPAVLSRPCHASLSLVTRSPTWTLHRREPARRRRRGLTLLLRPWRRQGASPGKLQQNTKKVRVRSARWSQVVWETWPGSRTRPRRPLPPTPQPVTRGGFAGKPPCYPARHEPASRARPAWSQPQPPRLARTVGLRTDDARPTRPHDPRARPAQRDARRMPPVERRRPADRLVAVGGGRRLRWRRLQPRRVHPLLDRATG